MTQEERRIYLIQYLEKEDEEYRQIGIPSGENEQKRLLRSLMNVRPPKEISKQFLEIQDEYLQIENQAKGIVSTSEMEEKQPGIYLWQGDITRLKVDAIVNAANSAMLGCFVPCHGCIDNAIHSSAGIQLRLECNRLMLLQGTSEKTGTAKITKAYNLPSKYVIHTVGPIIYGSVSKKEKEQLESCYQSCMELAFSYNLKSIAFCCISTGEFQFPNKLATQIAVNTVKKFMQEHNNSPEVIFNVFKDDDYKLYQQELSN